MTIKSNVAELVANESLFANAVTGITSGSTTYKEQVSTAVLAALHLIMRSKGNESSRSDSAQVAKLQSICDALYVASPRDLKVVEKFLSNVAPIAFTSKTGKNKKVTLTIRGTFIDVLHLDEITDVKERQKVLGKAAEGNKPAKTGTEKDRWNGVINFIDDKAMPIATGEKDSKGKAITEDRKFGGNIFDYYDAVAYFERDEKPKKTTFELAVAAIKSSVNAAAKVKEVSDDALTGLVAGTYEELVTESDKLVEALTEALKQAKANQIKIAKAGAELQDAIDADEEAKALAKLEAIRARRAAATAEPAESEEDNSEE